MKLSAKDIVSTVISAASLYIAATKWYDEKHEKQQRVAVQDTLGLMVKKHNEIILKYDEENKKLADLFMLLDRMERYQQSANQGGGRETAAGN